MLGLQRKVSPRDTVMQNGQLSPKSPSWPRWESRWTDKWCTAWHSLQTTQGSPHPGEPCSNKEKLPQLLILQILVFPFLCTSTARERAVTCFPRSCCCLCSMSCEQLNLWGQHLLLWVKCSATFPPWLDQCLPVASRTDYFSQLCKFCWAL